ncbi:hypothetical protein Q4Q34_01525 [Flavivirga abyssicola]|uniref:hypothetical protein n=1 Tax=Flavivirga abyssicola TaxID=3063533 RepID=UPI0026E0CD8D|nr:hypothetical protein [Flavivirga sp. MEBiC07777]WVK13719.1 hypothetical protein Q4Q34_01525 [Flavivirga sp. MEBiC07777]
MKKYSLIILLLIVALISCNIDDYDQPSDFSKPQLFTPDVFNLSENNIGNTIPISINDFSSLSDVSQGVVSRSWMIEEGSRFLMPDFTRKDSLNLADFIDPELGSSNGKDIANVLFQKAGETTVTLKNRFKEEVSLLGNDAVQTTDGLWELTTVFQYDVYNYLNAEASIFDEETLETYLLAADQNPSINDTSGFTTITIEAGSRLDFKDLTTIGRPSGRTWNFDGGQPDTSEEEEEEVTYNRTGDYLVTITSMRDNIRQSLRYSEQTKALPFIINVIPSTKPFVINGNAFALNDNSSEPGTKIIAFRVNGVLESFTDLENDFSVNVVNGAINLDIDVVSAEVSSVDETMIELVLAEPVLNSDTITLSYSGSAITSIDERILTPFTDAVVEPLFINLLTGNVNPSFENPASNARWANADGYRLFIGNGNQLVNAQNTDGTPFLDRSTERASDGSASMKFNAILPYETGIGFIGLSNILFRNADIPAGEYQLTYDLYYEPGTTFAGLFTRIFGATSEIEVMNFNPPATGEWFTVKRNITLGSGGITGNAVFNFRDNNENAAITGRQTFYIDNFKVIAVESR